MYESIRGKRTISTCLSPSLLYETHCCTISLLFLKHKLWCFLIFLLFEHELTPYPSFWLQPKFEIVRRTVKAARILFFLGMEIYTDRNPLTNWSDEKRTHTVCPYPSAIWSVWYGWQHINIPLDIRKPSSLDKVAY